MKKYRFLDNEKTWTIKTGDYTAVAFEKLIVSTVTSLTIKLPSTPDDLDMIDIMKDDHGSVYIDGNGKKINQYYYQLMYNNIFKITLIYYSELGYWVLNNNFVNKAILHFTNLYGNGYSSLGLNDLGMAWAWGFNNQGQLGTGNTTSYSSPVSVLGGISFTQLNNNIVGNFTIGIRGSDGTAWAWGYNNEGQLGTGNMISYSSPVSVVGGISFTKISTGDYFSLGIRGSDGTGWAWGWNIYGNLGIGNRQSYASPVSILGAISWKDISGGGGHSVGIRGLDGTAWAWGNNAAGNLGNGNQTSYSSPVSVLGGISFTQICSGQYVSLGIRGSDGTGWA